MTRVLIGEVFADKNMSQVGAAVCTLNLGAHPIWVRQPLHSTGDFVLETWPTAVGFKLALGTIKFGAAAFANICAFLPKREVFTSERHLGAFVNYYLLLFRSEFL